jgi:hypothetical protein
LDGGTYTPDAFNTGYTDVLAAKMQRIRHGQLCFAATPASSAGDSRQGLVSARFGCMALPSPGSHSSGPWTRSATVLST